MTEPDREAIFTTSWQDAGWWRVIETLSSGLPGRLWCETSVEQEAREALKECPYPAKLECHQRRCEERWVTP